MLRMFKSSTALVASLSLLVPHGAAFAQESSPDTSPAMICADGTQLPCAEGVEAIPAPMAAEPAAEPAPEPAAEPVAEPEPEPAPEPAAEPAPEPEASPEPAPEPVAEPVAEPTPEPEPEAQPETPTEAPDAETQPAAEEAPIAEPAPSEPAAAEEAPATEAPVEEAPSAEAPAEQPAAEQPAAQDPAPEAPAAEPAPAVEPSVEPAAPEAETPTAEDLEKALGEELNGSTTEPAPEAQAEPEAEPAPSEESAAEAAPATEPAAEAPAEETPVEAEATPTAEDLEKALAEQSGEGGEAPADATDLPVVTPATADIVEELAADGNLPSTEVVPDLPVQPEAETGEAPVAEAAQVLTESAGGQEAGSATADVPAEAVTQVTEEEVTADTARSSSEDFANKVNEAAGAKAAKVAQPQVVERKKGLSDTEKLLLLGAGALVVGAILSNNRKVEMNSGDRVIVSRDGQYYVLKDDDALLRQPGSRVRTETFRDGSTRTTVTRPDGSRIVTIRDAEQRVLRRVHVAPDGRETLLIDDLVTYEPVVVTKLPKSRPKPVDVTTADEEALRAALATQSDAGRRFSLRQVRNIWEVRSLVPVIDLDTITFESGSAAIRPDQAKALAGLGKLIQSYIRKDPSEVFLIEGHTDAVGSAAYNLALSDRRAESVALALTEYFGVPPENMVVQGYGEDFLKIDTQADERANRRASVRRITSLLR